MKPFDLLNQNEASSQNEGSIRLLVKPLLLICTADLLREKNTVPWLISRLIMTAEHFQSHSIES